METRCDNINGGAEACHNTIKTECCCDNYEPCACHLTVKTECENVNAGVTSTTFTALSSNSLFQSSAPIIRLVLSSPLTTEVSSNTLPSIPTITHTTAQSSVISPNVQVIPHDCSLPLGACCPAPIETCDSTEIKTEQDKDLCSVNQEVVPATTLQEVVNPQHKDVLWKTCTVCGKEIPDNVPVYLKDNRFICSNLLLIGLDVSKDDPGIHPPRVCTACRGFVHRLAKRNKKFANVVRRDRYNFVPHDHNCILCSGQERTLARLTGIKSDPKHINENEEKWARLLEKLLSSSLSQRLDSQISSKNMSECTSSIKDSDNRGAAYKITSVTFSSSPSPASLLLHRLKLARVCRICGQPRVMFSGQRSGSVIEGPLQRRLEVIFEQSFSDQDCNVHPLAVCSTCVHKVTKRSPKSSNFVLANFVCHEDSYCTVCSSEPCGASPGLFELTCKARKPLIALFGPKDHSISISKAIQLVNLEAPNSLHADKLVNGRSVVAFLKCYGCNRVPKYPLQSTCDHVYCSRCVVLHLVSQFQTSPGFTCFQSTCTNVIDSDSITQMTDVLLKKLHNQSMIFSCRYKANDCTFTGTLLEIEQHELECTAARLSSSNKRKGDKTNSLLNCHVSYLRQDRLKGAINLLQQFCLENYENEEEVAAFLHWNALTKAEKRIPSPHR